MTGQMALSLSGDAQTADVFEQVICMYVEWLMNWKDPLLQYRVIGHGELKFAVITQLLLVDFFFCTCDFINALVSDWNNRINSSDFQNYLRRQR